MTARIVRRPFTDAQGRKGLYKFFARAQPHVVRHYALTLPGWPRFERPLRIAFLSDLHVGSHTDDVTRYAPSPGRSRRSCRTWCCSAATT